MNWQQLHICPVGQTSKIIVIIAGTEIRKVYGFWCEHLCDEKDIKAHLYIEKESYCNIVLNINKILSIALKWFCPILCNTFVV